MKRLSVVVAMLITIAAVGCGSNKGTDNGADRVYGEWSSFVQTVLACVGQDFPRKRLH